MVNTWNAAASNWLFAQTGCDARWGGRASWGQGKKLLVFGPASKLEDAVDLAERYLLGEATIDKDYDYVQTQRLEEASKRKLK